MDFNELMERLQRPFPIGAHNFRVMPQGKFIAPYGDSRKAMALMDELLGFNWSKEVRYEWTKNECIAICTISVTLNGATARRDGIGSGKNPKDAETDAVKRAMMAFGVYRYLWESNFSDIINANGIVGSGSKGYEIAHEDIPFLKRALAASIVDHFGEDYPYLDEVFVEYGDYAQEAKQAAIAISKDYTLLFEPMDVILGEAPRSNEPPQKPKRTKETKKEKTIDEEGTELFGPLLDDDVYEILHEEEFDPSGLIIDPDDVWHVGEYDDLNKWQKSLASTMWGKNSGPESKKMVKQFQADLELEETGSFTDLVALAEEDKEFKTLPRDIIAHMEEMMHDYIRGMFENNNQHPALMALCIIHTADGERGEAISDIDKISGVPLTRIFKATKAWAEKYV